MFGFRRRSVGQCATMSGRPVTLNRRPITLNSIQGPSAFWMLNRVQHDSVEARLSVDGETAS